MQQTSIEHSVKRRARRSKDPTPTAARAFVAPVIAGMLLLLDSPACSHSTQELEIPNPDLRAFAEDAYPILLADCGYSACHGSGERFFAVYGPGRTRLLSDTDAYAPVTAQELALTYARARSMLVSPDGVRRSLLLRKPLAVSAGGAAHEGDDPWGGAIYASKRHPNFEALFRWAISEMPEPAP